MRLLRAAAHRAAKSGFGPVAQPFRWLRIYDDSAGKPALPTDPALGRLLLEIDLTGSVWIGDASFAQLSSTVTGTTLATGFPLYMRCASNDGLTVTDTDWVVPANSVTPSQELIENEEPDLAALNLLYPGQWLPSTDVQFGPGDLVYVP